VIARLERDFFAPARASYGEREWARAQATGAALSLADATELALEAGTSAS
jgi:hypothetical protein